TFFLRCSLVFCALVCFRVAAVGATLQAKVIDVTSGNVLVVTNINRSLKIRLKAVAPPEVGQPFSDIAREHLKALVFDKAVAVEGLEVSEVRANRGNNDGLKHPWLKRLPIQRAFRCPHGGILSAGRRLCRIQICSEVFSETWAVACRDSRTFSQTARRILGLS